LPLHFYVKACREISAACQAEARAGRKAAFAYGFGANPGAQIAVPGHSLIMRASRPLRLT